MIIELHDRTADSVVTYFRMTRDPEVRKYLPQKATTESEALADFEKTQQPGATSYGRTIYVDGNYIGDVWCYCIQRDEPNAMVSYCIFDKAYWNKGVATKALQLFLSEIADKFMLKSVGAFAFSANKSSIKVLLKNGFTEAETFVEDGIESKYFQRIADHMEHKGTKQFETDRLVLRPFSPKDADSCIRNWATDPEVYRYMSQEAQTPQDVYDWLSSADEAYASLETYYWAIVERASGEVIGEIFVDDFGVRNSWCELDWKIGKAFWGNGYTTEAAKAIIRYLIDEVGFHRVQAKCCVENPASERVMQKVGMTKDGILRSYFHTKGGRWSDVVMYAILESD